MQASTLFFLLIPKNVKSERPIALLPSLDWPAWEALLEKEKYTCNVEEMDQGAVTLVGDLAKALEKGQLKVVWAWASQHQRRVILEGCVADPLQTITAILPRSKWSCVLLRIVLQDALSEMIKLCPWTTSSSTSVERIKKL